MTSPIVFVCEHVLKGKRSPKTVVHHSDGMWQITCGERGHGIFWGKIKPVCIEHVIGDMGFLVDLAPRLTPGHKAEYLQNTWEISEERG